MVTQQIRSGPSEDLGFFSGGSKHRHTLLNQFLDFSEKIIIYTCTRKAQQVTSNKDINQNLCFNSISLCNLSSLYH